MKQIIIPIFLVIFSSAQSQNFSGFNFEAGYTADLANNLYGGMAPGSVYLGKIDLIMGINSSSLNLWKGGLLYTHVLNTHGSSLSSLVGDLQISSNIEAEPSSRLYQFWYRQKLRNFTVLIGQHDLNSEFLASENAGYFMNSSFGMQPDVSMNASVSIFPLTALGFVLRYDINSSISLTSGLYDGTPENTDTKFINCNFNKHDGCFYINEFQYIKKYNIYKLGVWYHSKNKIDNQNQISKNRYGLYFIGDFNLYTTDAKNKNGLWAFLQFGVAPKDNYIGNYVGFGINYKGLNKKFKEDVLGISYAKSSISEFIYNRNDSGNDCEQVIELTYLMKINKHIYLQPDFQFIFNPGINAGLKDAFVGILRIIVNY